MLFPLNLHVNQLKLLLVLLMGTYTYLKILRLDVAIFSLYHIKQIIINTIINNSYHIILYATVRTDNNMAIGHYSLLNNNVQNFN